MKSSISLLMLTCSFLSLTPAQAQADGRRDIISDAMALAVEVYGQNGSREIEPWSREHDAMRSLLLQLNAKFPLLESVAKVRQHDYGSSDIFYAQVMRDLEIKEDTEAGIAKVSTFFSQALSECPHSVSVESYFSEGSAGKLNTLITQTKFDLHSCQSAKAQAIMNAGVGHVQLTDVAYTGESHILFGLISANQPGADIVTMKKKLLAISELESAVSSLSFPIDSMHHSDIKVTTTGKALKVGTQFDVELSWNWGDCTSGCSKHYKWLVKATVRKPLKTEAESGHKFGFKLEMISEGGDELQTKTILNAGTY